MSPFIAVFVKFGREFPIEFWRNDRNDPRFIQIFTEPVGIERAIREEHFARNTFDQFRRFPQIVSLPRHQAKTGQVIKRIRQSQNIGDADHLAAA